jgi:hypothetical protein
MREFSAWTVGAAEIAEFEALVAVFAEHSDGTGSRLELQRAITFDEQDKKLGHDTYCLSTETGATYYGGVESWTLDATLLELLLAEEAAQALGVQDGFRIRLAAANQDLLTLRAMLRQILE